VQLDDLVKVLSYEELENVLTGGTNETPDEEPAEEETPAETPVTKEEAPTKKAEEKIGSCPSGHKYGKDWGECKECDNCLTDVYRACRKASRE
jgi:hypothetical protein